MSDVGVRPARLDDAAAVASIRIAGWRSYGSLIDAEHVASGDFARQAQVSAVAWIGDLDNHGRSPSGATMLVHELTDGVDGWVSFGPDRNSGSAGEIWGLYVAARSWGSGTAQRLLHAASDALRSQGFTSLELWCLDGNERALRFYQREGWSIDGARTSRDFGPAGVADEVRLRFTGDQRDA